MDAEFSCDESLNLDYKRSASTLEALSLSMYRKEKCKVQVIVPKTSISYLAIHIARRFGTRKATPNLLEYNIYPVL